MKTRRQIAGKTRKTIIFLGTFSAVFLLSIRASADVPPPRQEPESSGSFVTIKAKPVQSIIDNARQLSAAERHEEAVASYNHALDVTRDKIEKKTILKEKKQERIVIAAQERQRRLDKKKAAAEKKRQEAQARRDVILKAREQKRAEAAAAAEAEKRQAEQQKEQLRIEREQKLAERREAAEVRKQEIDAKRERVRQEREDKLAQKREEIETRRQEARGRKEEIARQRDQERAEVLAAAEAKRQEAEQKKEDIRNRREEELSAKRAAAEAKKQQLEEQKEQLNREREEKIAQQRQEAEDRQQAARERKEELLKEKEQKRAEAYAAAEAGKQQAEARKEQLNQEREDRIAQQRREAEARRQAAQDRREQILQEKEQKRIEAAAKTLHASSVTGINNTVSTYLDTDVDYITASASGAGDIYIQEEDGVTLTSVTAANGSIGIVTGNEAAGDAIVTNVVAAGSGADIDITADLGDIYLATVTAADDSVSITASNGAIFDDNVNTTKVTATDLSLSAVGQIGAPGTEGDIDTTTTNLTAATTNGDIYITDDDAVTLTSITTGTGSITIKNGRSSSGNMTVTLVTAGTSDAGDGDVTLETLDGNIILSGPVSAQNDSVTLISSNDVTDNYGSGPDIVASALYLQAGGSFGTSGNPIVTQVSTIDDVAIGSNVAGNIYISEYDGVDLGSLNGLSTDNGNIYVNSNATANGDLVASNITAGGSGDIYLTSQDGAGGTNDIALGYVNAQGNTVTLVSDDNITDEDADPDIDVVANILYLEAAGDCGASGTDAAIDTDVAYISNRSASTVVAGALYINENSGVTLGADGSNTYGLTSTSGPIYITAANGADGNLIATSVITVNSSAPITLITNAGVGGLNDINVKYISSTSSTVTLVSDNDITAVDDSSSITATSLLLEANGSAGTSSLPLRVYSSYIDDRSASANVYGNIYITVLDLASPTAATIRLGYINGLSTDNGNISITLTGAGDTLSAVSVTAGGTGDVTLVTSGASSDIAVGLITALDDDVYLYAQNRITDSDTTEVDVIANGLYLRTDYGSVGSSTNYLDVQVTTIDNQSAGNVYGSIYISEYDGVNLGSVNGLTTDTGSIYVTSNATADGTLIATLVTARGSGDISLKSQAGASSTGNVNDIEVGLLTASGDDVILNSNDDIIDLTYDEVVDIEASGLYLAAGGTVGGDGSGRELDTRVSTIDDISGSNVYESIYIIEYDGVSLGSVNGLTTDTGDIDITAANTAAGDMDAVSVTAGGEGNILLITLDGGSVSNSINVGLVTAEGDDVSLVSDGDITDADTTGLDVVASVLYLQSGGAVGTSANYLDTKVANIDDYSGGNVGTDLYINEYDGVTLGSLNTSTGLSTTDGEIRVIAAATAAGDLTATLLTAGGTGNNIYLTTADGGSGTNSIGLGLVTAEDDDVIIDSDYDVTDSDADSAADVVADGLYLDALGSVGTSTDRVETTVNTIDDYALGVNVSGSIYISETDAVTLGSIFGLTTDAGVIDIVAGGTITTGTLAANGGFGIFLNSTGGDLVDLVNGSFTATAKSELRTGGIIGTIENPYDVNVTSGGLWVWAGSQNREVSANLRGTVVSSADTERVEIFEPSPPGLVIFDNHLMGGGNYGSGSANGSILSRGYGYISVFRADFIDSVYARALEQPWGYKLLLAWALAEGPKVDEKLMSDVPTVIDVTQLNLPVLYMDMNKPMDYYVIRSIR